MRRIPTLWARRLAVFAVLAGVLVQSALALPLSLRMAGTPICTVAHGGGGADTPGLPVHDHAHCLLCQASAAPPLPPGVPTLAVPSVAIPVVVHTVAAWTVLAHRAVGFSSRAPPALA